MFLHSAFHIIYRLYQLFSYILTVYKMSSTYNMLKSPQDVLLGIAKEHNLEFTEMKFCTLLDGIDKLANFRKQFLFPNMKSSSNVNQKAPFMDNRFLVSETEENQASECIYFCGNSLGLQPKQTAEAVNKVLESWSEKGVDCHFNGFLPAALCDHCVEDSMSKLVGASPDEIAIMNGLTVNLHLLLVSFYQPTASRHKILLETKAFPSDHYAVESQIKQRGFDPKESMLLLQPREGEDTWRHDDIINTIEREGDSIALVMLSGIHYYTGQLFDMEAITKAAHRKGCLVGFDLAHAVGNVELRLNEWDVDFACWCSYKYLNSGPGGIAGAFIHKRHEHNDFSKFIGWWGHDIKTRLDMKNNLELTPGVQGYRLTNPSPVLVGCLRASLDIFDQTSMKDIRQKSLLLTGYLEMLLKHYFTKGKATPYIDIITPSDVQQRGSQLSLSFSCSIEKVHEMIEERGVMCDVRKPNVMRIAPVPLYNSFTDVFRFVQILKEVL